MSMALGHASVEEVAGPLAAALPVGAPFIPKR